MSTAAGAAHSAGVLSVSVYGGYQPHADDPLTINFVQPGSIDGAFSIVQLPPLPEGMTWDQSRVSEDILVLVPEPSTIATAGFVICILGPRCRRSFRRLKLLRDMASGRVAV